MDTRTPDIEVIEPARPGRRREYSPEEKRKLLDEAAMPGNSISSVARKHGLSPSLLFRWRRLFDEGALSSLGADERVVPESEIKQVKNRIRELERQLGKKTLENEILKEGLELVREKKLLSRSLSPDKGGSR
jgi:transposase